MYETEQRKLENLSTTLKDRVDGEITLDLHGNMKIKHTAVKDGPNEGIQGTGTYVLRDGKLVEGKGMVRE